VRNGNNNNLGGRLVRPRWSRKRRAWLSLASLIPDLGAQLLHWEYKLRPDRLNKWKLQEDLGLVFPSLPGRRIQEIEQGIKARLHLQQLYQWLTVKKRYQELINMVDWPRLETLLQELRKRPVILCFWHTGPFFSQVVACHALGIPTYAIVGGAQPFHHIGRSVELVALAALDTESQDRANIVATALDRLHAGHIVLISLDHAAEGRPVSYLNTIQTCSQALPFLAKRTGAAVFPLTTRFTPNGRWLCELGPELSESEDLVLEGTIFFEDWIHRFPEEVRLERLDKMAKQLRARSSTS